MRDLFGDGIFAVDGDKWRHQRKLASYEFSWGKDAEEFLPGRWLCDGVFISESRFKFTAFHAGPRMCLGKEFAYRQMKISAAVLLNFFKFELVDEKKEATYRTMFTLQMDQGLHLYASPRL